MDENNENKPITENGGQNQPVIPNNFFEIIDTEKPIEADDRQKAVSLNEIRNRSNKKKKHKNHKGIGALIWVISIIAVSVALSSVALMAFSDIVGITFSEPQTYEITIPEGASTEQIANILKDAGAIKHPLIFRLYSKLKKEDGKYQYGYYTFKSGEGYSGIISTLQTIGAVAEEKTVTIPEGSSIEDICKIFVESGLCEKTEFVNAIEDHKYNYSFLSDIPTESVYYQLEGYLYPDTYRFAYVKDEGENNAVRAVDKMLTTMRDRVFTDENIAKAKKLGYSMHEVLTMASIVQLEAGAYPKQMPRVAQVFYNRLESPSFTPKMLQSDPTEKYPDSHYHTYSIEGLPPGPLDSPSLDAIEGALNPDKSITAFYFVTDKNGGFYYSATLSEHKSVIASLQSKGLWE